MAVPAQFLTIACSSKPHLSLFPENATAGFLEFKGLRIQSCRKSSVIKSRSSTSRVCGQLGGRIVCQSMETALDVPTVTDSTWQSLVLDADGLVLVELYAPWCGPCRLLHPLIGELSQEYAGQLKCLKLNTDDSGSIAKKYGILRVPAVLLFLNGEVQDSIVGAVPKATLIGSIKKFV